MQCDKCGVEKDHPMRVVRGGEIYNLCDKCIEYVEKFPRNSEEYHHFFLPMINKRNEDDWVDKNIKEARERREKGINLWK